MIKPLPPNLEAPPKDSCGKGSEFQGSLPKIRKVVSDGTPSRRISANPKLLLGKGFALGNKRPHVASISQPKFSPPNAPRILRLLSAAPRLESQAQSIPCGPPRDLKRSRPRGEDRSIVASATKSTVKAVFGKRLKREFTHRARRTRSHRFSQSSYERIAPPRIGLRPTAQTRPPGRKRTPFGLLRLRLPFCLPDRL